MLWNDCAIVLADISLCLPTRGSVPWLRDPGSTVTLFGYLERTQVTFYARQSAFSLKTDGCGGTVCQVGQNALFRPPANAAAP